MSYYNEYAVIPTRTPKNELYHTLDHIPPPMHIGSEGDSCKTNLNCHQPLKCNSNKCGQWVPPPSSVNTQNTQKLQSQTKGVKERFQSVPEVDFYELSPDYEDFPITTKPSKTLQYTSSAKANSGRNYW